ncbi:MAG: hypothetical protein J0H96_01245 [Microbacterium ginsengisoli]|nr:hypothetical protein [Microbacterium ginsengisoli]
MIRIDRPTHAEVSILHDLGSLIEAALWEANRASDLHRPNAERTLRGAMVTLDRVRTRLVEEGADYIDEAEAFMRGGRTTVAEWRAYLDGAQASRAAVRA